MNRINNPYSNVKQMIYEELFPGTDNKVNQAYNIGMLSLILLNILAVILETEASIYQRAKILFYVFEVASVIIFTIEYTMRIWVCTEDPRYKNPISGRLKFFFDPMTIIDLLSFLPFYLPFFSIDLRFLRALRLFRLFRLFKVGRYSQSLSLLTQVFKSKKEELLITLFSIFILLVVASSLMYLVENRAQPENFSSIPSAMWWGVATLTTVGYGDIYPVTVIGKIFGSIIAILGIGLFALPTGIIASGFSSELQSRKLKKVCPHCGKPIDD